MTQAVGVRTTSFVASAALLGAAVIAGLTMTIVQQAAPPWEGTSVTMAPVIDDPPPQRPRESAPPLRPIEGQPFEPMDQTILPEATTIAMNDAGPTYAPPPTILNPQWVRRPRDLARYYPARALSRGQEGRAVLDCVVSVTGALACVVVSETPASWGFGDAALRISRDYQMVPATRDGAPVEARHRMVVPFELQ
jgi:protein TonB